MLSRKLYLSTYSAKRIQYPFPNHYSILNTPVGSLLRLIFSPQSQKSELGVREAMKILYSVIFNFIYRVKKSVEIMMVRVEKTRA